MDNTLHPRRHEDQGNDSEKHDDKGFACSSTTQVYAQPHANLPGLGDTFARQHCKVVRDKPMVNFVRENI